MVAVLASFTAWLCPTFGFVHKGFDPPAQLDFTSFMILACWYGLIFISFSLGEKAGNLRLFRRNALRDCTVSVESNLVYYSFTLITTIATIATSVRVLSLLSVQQAFVFVTMGQTNELKDALYQDYSIGLFSLRHVVVFSSAIALYRMIRWKSFTLINIFNTLLLFVNSFLLASRLTFVATVLTTLLILTFDKRTLKLSLTKTASVATLLFLLLSVANSSRNAGYYEDLRLSFLQAGFSEIVSYLGSPFQMAIGSARFTDQLVAAGDQTYRNYADEQITLNTNSAFVHLHEQFGYSSWPYIAGICLLMGFLFEFLASLGRTVFLLPSGAILYASAELWRLDLFHQGIFIVWMVVGIGFPVFLLVVRYRVVGRTVEARTHLTQ